jgi:hypothetical protein
MSIAGSGQLSISAAPKSPGGINYTVTNPSGVSVVGFILTNTANVPVNVTIYQDNLLNTLTSATLAAGASTTILQQFNMLYGQTILSSASTGGVVNIEIDGVINSLTALELLVQKLLVMFSAEFGTEIPSDEDVSALANP